MENRIRNGFEKEIRNKFGSDFRAFYSSICLQMKHSYSRGMMKFTLIFSPLFMGVLLGFVYLNRSAEDFASYAMVGTAVTTMWTTISFSSASDVNRERYMGALQQIYNTPQHFFTIMLGKVVGNTILGVIAMVLSYVYVGVLFQRWVVIESLAWFIVAFSFLVISYIALAMMLSGALAISRQLQVLMNCLDYPMFILCGCVFPVTILPEWAQAIGNLLSPTHGIAALRLCLNSEFQEIAFYQHLTALIVTTAIYWVLSVFLYRHMDHKVRKDATLEVM